MFQIPGFCVISFGLTRKNKKDGDRVIEVLAIFLVKILSRNFVISMILI